MKFTIYQESRPGKRANNEDRLAHCYSRDALLMVIADGMGGHYYGEIAAQLAEPGAARAVGQALGQNPMPIISPCHRVLAAGQRPGGFSAHGEIATKRRLLEIEGALAAERLPLFSEANHVR